MLQYYADEIFSKAGDKMDTQKIESILKKCTGTSTQDLLVILYRLTAESIPLAPVLIGWSYVRQGDEGRTTTPPTTTISQSCTSGRDIPAL